MNWYKFNHVIPDQPHQLWSDSVSILINDENILKISAPKIVGIMMSVYITYLQYIEDKHQLDFEKTVKLGLDETFRYYIDHIEEAE
jgi:hypothetical protein